MSAASLFATLEGYDWTRATVIGTALATAGNTLALHRSVNSRA